MNKINRLIQTAATRQASDIHVVAGNIAFRVFGVLRWSEGELINEDEINKWLNECLGLAGHNIFKQCGSVDFAYEGAGCRCRINAFKSRGQPCMTIRLLTEKLPELDELELTDLCRKLMARTGGLVIIGGCTGAGKSTTAGAILNWINKNYARRIVTLEDPVEYIFSNQQSFFCQREYGHDFFDFASGVRDTLRQDADILFIGEIRDAATVEAAFSAAESGRLVLATLHCADTVQAVERLTMLFEPNRQQYVRFQLAASLCCVINQRLVRLRSNQGRRAIQEILLITSAIANLIRENKYHQLAGQLELGSSRGMRTFQSSLAALKQSGILLAEEGSDGSL